MNIRKVGLGLGVALVCAIGQFASAATIPAGATLQGTGTSVPNSPVSILNSDGTVCNFGPGGNCSGAAVASLTTTNGSGAIATGGTFQSILAASSTRKGCLIQNPTTASEPLYVYFGANASATTANAITLAPGGAVNCAVGLGVATDNVSATATTTSHAYVEMSQ